MAVDPGDIGEWIASSSGTVLELAPDSSGLLQRTIDATEAHMEALYDAPIPDVEGNRPADWELAVIMQSARLWQRRATPNGIGGFGDFGAVRISSLDPDVANLLRRYLESGIA